MPTIIVWKIALRSINGDKLKFREKVGKNKLNNKENV